MKTDKNYIFKNADYNECLINEILEMVAKMKTSTASNLFNHWSNIRSHLISLHYELYSKSRYIKDELLELTYKATNMNKPENQLKVVPDFVVLLNTYNNPENFVEDGEKYWTGLY